APGMWSEAALFQVAAGPSELEFKEAFEAVQRYLAVQGRDATTVEVESKRESQQGPSAETPTPLAPPPGTQLSVDGNVDATSFSGSGTWLTDLDPANLSAGTAGIDISGTAANVTGTVALANGGTGATDAAGARTSLGVVGGAHTTDTDTTCDGATCDATNFTNLNASNLSMGTVAEPRIDPVVARDAELTAALEALDCPSGRFLAQVDAGAPVCVAPFPETTSVPGGAAVTIGAAAATPYPSTLTVASFGGAALVDVNVTLTELTHTFPLDMRVLLVAPTGQAVLLMSVVGGGGPGVTNVDLTFDDEAGQTIGLTTNPLAGSYRPSVNIPEDLPAPAPSGPYGTSLSDFDGIDPVGEWQLFVQDVFEGADDGSLASWSLALTTDGAPIGPVPVVQGGTGATDVAGALTNLGVVAGPHTTCNGQACEGPLFTNLDGSNISTGTVAEARIADEIARDAEVMSIALAGDGPGSTLNADLLDGLDSVALKTKAGYRQFTGAQVSIDTEFPTFTEVSSVSLDAGKYVVIANTGLWLTDIVISSIIQSSAVLCRLASGALVLESRGIGPPGLSGTFGWPTSFRTHVTLIGAVTLAAPGSVAVQCTVFDSDGDSRAIVGSWVTIQVDSIDSL
ncbi:MAG: proprotein convertase P-domain-containing protein, partial [Acidimicrobiia bacterium]